MYLTKLELNARHKDARRDLANPYEMHKTIRRAYGDTEDRILFRVEPNEKGISQTVLVQSITAPDWRFLERERFGYVYQLNSKAFDPQFVAGQYLLFSLIANPTRKERRKEENKNGRRVSLIKGVEGSEEAHKQTCIEGLLKEWIQQKGDQNGFQVLDVDAKTNWLSATKQEDGKAIARKQDIPHFAVHYKGLLKVSDPEALKAALASGIGSGKAFGFGLLTVSKV